MSNGQEFVDVGSVDNFLPGDPPVDITDEVRAVRPDAIKRVLTRIETGFNPSTLINGDPDRPDPPSFYSIARTCTHEGCNILRGSPAWRMVSEPIDYCMELRQFDTGVEFAVIECPCHGSRYDLRTGKILRRADEGHLKDLARFATKVEKVNGDYHVFVAIDPEPTS